MTTRRGFGKLRKLPSGRWQARYRHPDGRERSAPQTFPTKTAAQRFLATVDADLARGQFRDPEADRVIFGDWARRYLAGHAVTIKPSTAASYESLYKTCLAPTFAGTPLAEIRRSDVRAMVASLTANGLGPSRVRKALVLLRLVLDAAVEDDLIVANVARGVHAPRLPSHEPRILTPEEVAALHAAIREPYGVLVDVFAYAGLRLGEALALRRRHVAVLRGRLLVRESVVEVNGYHHIGTPKNHQAREVTLPSFLLAELVRYLEEWVDVDPASLLFPSRTGRPLHYTSLRRNIWDPATRAAGFPGVTPHALRATCGTWTADAAGVLAAAQRLGHSNASVTTRHYARARVGVEDEAAQRLGALRASVPESTGARRGHADPVACPESNPK